MNVKAAAANSRFVRVVSCAIVALIAGVAFSLVFRSCVYRPDTFSVHSRTGQLVFENKRQDILGIGNAYLNSKRYSYAFHEKTISRYAGDETWKQCFAPISVEQTTVTVVFPGFEVSLQTGETSTLVQAPARCLFIGPVWSKGPGYVRLFLADYSTATFWEQIYVFGDNIEYRVYPITLNLQTKRIVRSRKVGQVAD
ncbi:MAG: hypothetical protein ACR2IE_14990 [Candidatus Sumerlaeaceae bacterium]